MTDREKLVEVDRLRKEADHLIAEAEDHNLAHDEVIKKATGLLAAAAVFRTGADERITEANRNIAQASLLMREITGDMIN